jgi:polyisoprenoid-binding protein YceI
MTIAPIADASFVLEVEKTGIMAGKTHRFVFTAYQGEVSDDAPTDGGKRVSFTIQSASIRCEDTWVSEKDRAKILRFALDNMLRANEYPLIRYASTAIHASGQDSYSVDGTLTIGATARPVAVSAMRQLDHTGKAWFNGSAVISLTDFGLKPPSAALGTVGTKDKMQLSFHLAVL